MKESRQFIHDCSSKEMYYGTVVRSPISKGTIQSIQLPSDLPGDFTFCRMRDIPGSNFIRIFDHSIPLLADKQVDYEGQPLMLLAGSSFEKLEAVSKQLFIQYQQEPALPSIGRYEPAQVIGSKELTRGKPAAAFKKAFQVIESSYQFYYQGQITQDPEGAYAEYRDGVLHIYVTTNWPAHVRHSAAEVLQVPEKDIIIHPLRFPPSYEGKLWRPSVTAVFAALLAWKSKHPVRIMIFPEPFNHTSHTKNSSLIRIKSAISRTGALEALEVKIDYDCGAFPAFPDEILRRSLYTVYFQYPCANISLGANLIKTSTRPVFPTPSFGAAHIQTAMESEMNRIAEIAGMSPGDWRLENIISKTEEREELPALLDSIIEASDYARKFSVYEMMKKRRNGFPNEYTPVRGIGLASGSEGCGFSGPLEGKLNPYMALRLDDERKATIITSAVGRDNSIGITWKRMVGSLLDIPADSVHIDQRGLEHGIDSGPSVLSRNIAVLTPLLQQCCDGVNKKRFRSPLPIEVKRSLRISKASKWDEETLSGSLFRTSSYGTAVVEVEINTVTLEIEVRGIWLSVFCGTVVNKDLLEPTLEAGVFHAIRWAAAEDIWLRYPRETGVYTPADISLEEADIRIEVKSGGKKFEPRGIEMLPYALVPPAFLSALSQAANIYFDTLPQYPDTIQQMMEEM